MSSTAVAVEATMEPSSTNQTPSPTSVSPATKTAAAAASAAAAVSEPRVNVVRLCGTLWAPCGYCKGSRAHLSQMNAARDVNEEMLRNISAATTTDTEVESSKSYSVVASNLTPAVYEQFLSSGWRRSGISLYKPMNSETCCPALTIRLSAPRYQPTKSQRKVMKRMDTLLQVPADATSNARTGTKSVGVVTQGKRAKMITRKETKTTTATVDDQWIETVLQHPGVLDSFCELTRDALKHFMSEIVQSDTKTPMNENQIPTIRYKAKAPRRDVKQANNSREERVQVDVFSTACATVAGQSNGRIDRSVLVQRVVDQLRKSVTALPPQIHGATSVEMTSVQGHAASGHIILQLTLSKRKGGSHSSGESMVDDISSLNGSLPTTPMDSDDRFRSWWIANQLGIPPSPPYELAVTTVSAHESALDPRVHKLYWEYQHAVHNDHNPLGTTPVASESVDPDTESTVKANEASDDDSANTDGWGRDYAPLGWRERALNMLSLEYGHLPESTQKRLIRSYASFYEFLVENPFHGETAPTDDTSASNNKAPTGTYHQHYTMSGNVLVAVGVVDVLPTGLSSVYLFYCPSFAHQLVPLGKYAIRKEIEWTKQAGLPYYYLGYYIESCPKMVYKGDYQPSELLCSVTNKWVDSKEGRVTIRRESPEHHCCTLYKKQNTTNDIETSETNDQGSSKTVMDLRLDVGVPSLVTLSMLHTDSQAIVRPFLIEFVDHICPEVAVQCTVSFR